MRIDSCSWPLAMAGLRTCSASISGLCGFIGLRGGVLSPAHCLGGDVSVVGCKVKAAATCSSNFCLTRVLRFSARSILETQSSIDVSSSYNASSCLRILSWENFATRGERRYEQMRLCRLRRPSLNDLCVLLRYSHRSSSARSSCH